MGKQQQRATFIEEWGGALGQWTCWQVSFFHHSPLRTTLHWGL
ncbi:MAG: hypothetical protein ACK58N_16785 [Synechocystis sp.]